MAIVDVAIAAGTALGVGGAGIGAGLVGGAAIGAGVGGLYSGLTGDGNVLNSMLNGALIGGGIGGGGAALGLTGASGTSLGLSGAGSLSGVGSALGLGSAAAPGVVAPVAGMGAPTLGTVADVSSQIAPNISSMISANPGNMDLVAQSLQDTYGMTANQANAAIAQNMAGTGTTGGINMATANAADKAAGIASNIGPSTTPGFWDSTAGTAAKWGAGLMAANSIIGNSNKKYGTLSPSQVQSLPLQYQSNFGTYKPLDTTVMRPMGPATGYSGTPYGTPGYIGSPVGYAAGGIADANNGATPAMTPPGGPVEQMSRDNALGQNQMFPQSQLQSSTFSSPTNTPMGSNLIAAAGDTNVDPYTGAEKFATGGIAGHSTLGSYAAGGNPRLLKGPGTGLSDDIPAIIGHKQPARLADGEYVVSSDVVSALGGGSTDAGAKKLSDMMDRVRSKAHGTKKQIKKINDKKVLPA